MDITHAVPPNRLSVGFVLTRDFTLSAFANFVDVLRLAADEGDRSRRIHCDWQVLSADMNPIVSSAGVRIQPDTRLRLAGRFDYIVVVGGLIGRGETLTPELVTYLRENAEAGVPLVGLCTGVFQLYAAGLLEGYRACVSWFHHRDFTDRFAGATPVSNQIFVVDRDRLTCSGGHSAAHLAAFVVERHLGQVAAAKSLSILMIDGAQSGERPQPALPETPPARDPVVRKALIRMQQSIDEPESIPDLARQLGVGRKTLERRFRDDLGAPPSRIAMDLRLDHAARLLAGSTRSVTDIALACGFCDVPHLIRAFRKRHGMTPGDFRQAHASVAAP
ncbi:GlxA family transcriptional regulator [Palleronia sp. LCG004]|uniref:GlxA family transcriptional regulator n=1 Tax=Palleronia sp. LCG004 TaxID=3079304 RepID=UPI002941D5D6|nr:GlxA family transcriptional regulator [Palleronia sp. LCG004]WOI56696.1 GlxA family transcriptional regulator [Palleronia sp. LCG004]